MSAAGRPHCPGCPLTAEQWAALRELLSVPDNMPDEHVGEAVLAALEIDRTLAAEFDYLRTAVKLGWWPAD